MNKLSPAAQRAANAHLQELEQIEAAMRDGDLEACRDFIRTLSVMIAIGGHKALALLARSLIEVLEAAAAGDAERLDWLVRYEEPE